MEKKEILRHSLINSILTTLYVVLVASFIYSMGKISFEDTSTVIAPISVLMLLVFSVAFVGSLIFGRPAMWYVDGKKKEAIVLLFYTLGFFLALTIIIFLLFLGFVF